MENYRSLTGGHEPFPFKKHKNGPNRFIFLKNEILNIIWYYLGDSALSAVFSIKVYPVNLEAMIEWTSKQANKQAEVTTLYILAWEPSAVKVTKSYFRRLPALGWFYQENKFSLLKSTHSIKSLKTKLSEHSRGSPEFPS